MKFTGSYFVEDGAEVHSTEDYGVTVVFDGSGGLFVNMSDQVAEQLLFELRAVLDGKFQDQLEWVETPGLNEIGVTHVKKGSPGAVQ